VRLVEHQQVQRHTGQVLAIARDQRIRRDHHVVTGQMRPQRRAIGAVIHADIE